MGKKPSKTTYNPEDLGVILEGLSEGVTAQDPKGVIVYANQIAADLMGYRTPKEIIGTKGERIVELFDMHNAEGEPLQLSQIPSRIALKGKPSPKITIRFRPKRGGQERWTRVHATPIFNDAGKVSLVVNVIRDITERKLTELKLERSQVINKFLADAGAILSSSLDFKKTLSDVAKLLVPTFADWCAVDMIGEKGTLERLAVTHKDPKKIKLAYELETKFPAKSTDAGSVNHVVATGIPSYFPSISDSLVVKTAKNPEHLELLRKVGFAGMIIVPITIKQEACGAFIFVSSESKRHFTEEDLNFAKELARRAGLAIENARLYEREKNAKAELEQRVEQRTQELKKANEILKKEIVEKIKASESLKEKEQLLRLVLDTLPVAVWVTDKAGKIIMENPAGQEIWGQKTFLGVENYSQYKAWWADSGKRVDSDELAIFRALSKGEDVICDVINIEALDGMRKTILNSAYPIRDEYNEIIGAVIVNEDISDRQKSAEELTSSRKELREFIDSMATFSAKLDTKGKFLIVNTAMQRMLGLTEQELKAFTFLGGPWWKYDEEVQEKVTKAFDKAAKGQQTELEERMLVEGNHFMTAHIIFTPIYNEQQEVSYIVLECRNVTAQKNAEEQLRQSEQRLEEAQKIAHMGSWEWEVFYNIVIWSDELCRIYGVEPGFNGNFDEFLARVHPDDKEQVKNTIDKAFKKKQPFDFIHRIVCPDGSVRTLHARGDVTVNRKGDVIKMFGTGLDITDQQKAQEQLRMYTKELELSRANIQQDKAKDEAILSSMGDGIIATDTQGRIIMINPQAELLLGYRKQELIGKTVFEITPLLDQREQNVPEKERPTYIALHYGKKVTNPGYASTYYYVKKNGEKFPVSITSTPIVLKNKIIGSIQIFRDITREKAIDRAKTEFVSLASHQLRTPLSALNWYTEAILSEEIGKLNPKQKLYLEQMRYGNKRIIDLVNDLLNVSRIDLGTFVVEPEIMDIKALTQAVLDEHSALIKQKKLALSKSFSKSVPKLHADPKLVRVIVQNLITNAVKYTPAKGKISVNVQLSKESTHPQCIVLTVADTGYGIPKNQQAKIFTKLFRADNVLKKDTDGTGLGLYMVKAITQYCGGKIWFESKENKGSKFYVELPVKTKVHRSLGKKLL